MCASLDPQIQNDNSRRKKLVIILAVSIFFVVCLLWVLVMRFGFLDFNARWISGTHTYNASGDETSKQEGGQSLSEVWNEASDTIGASWNTFMKTMDALTQKDEEAMQNNTSTKQEETATNTSL